MKKIGILLIILGSISIISGAALFVIAVSNLFQIFLISGFIALLVGIFALFKGERS
jgi:hypothetical protein